MTVQGAGDIIRAYQMTPAISLVGIGGSPSLRHQSIACGLAKLPVVKLTSHLPITLQRPHNVTSSTLSLGKWGTSFVAHWTRLLRHSRTSPSALHPAPHSSETSKASIARAQFQAKLPASQLQARLWAGAPALWDMQDTHWSCCCCH